MLSVKSNSITHNLAEKNDLNCSGEQEVYNQTNNYVNCKVNKYNNGVVKITITNTDVTKNWGTNVHVVFDTNISNELLYNTGIVTLSVSTVVVGYGIIIVESTGRITVNFTGYGNNFSLLGTCLTFITNE